MLMTKKELYNALKGVPMNAVITLVDATDFKDVEYQIDAVCVYPLDVPRKKRDSIEIVFNEGRTE